VLTTSAGAHLLLVGFLGRGLPAELPRPRPLPAAPPVVRVIENVALEAPPPPPPPKAPREILQEAPPPEPDLPSLDPVAAIAAIPATVKVDFAVLATGPVVLVNSIGDASGGRQAPLPDEPLSVDGPGAGGQLLSPPPSYPADAKLHHHTGTVLVEFRTNPTGEILGARVLRSSGHYSLDRDALQKTRESRFTGKAGYYFKAYEYELH